MGITRKNFVMVLAGLALTSAVSVGAQNRATAGSSMGAKTVPSAKTAIKGGISDASGETYGVVGVSNSPDGAGLGAANTGGGADLVLDGIADGQVDTILTQAGIDRPSGVDQTFTLQNSGAGLLEFYVNGILYGNGGGLTNVDAASLGGSIPEEFALNVELAVSGLSSVHWDNLTDLPTWLDDGDDDTLGGLSCTEGQIARWDGASWVCSHDVGVEYSRTRVVGPVGTPTDNGAVLLDMLGSIPTPASQAVAWLLKIEPGIYDVGSTPFEMKSWVDVEGSGEGVTLIRGAICEFGWTFTTGVVEGAQSAELRSLSVENTCSGENQNSTAIYNNGDDARFSRVTARAFGAAEYNHAVYNEGLDVVFEFITAEAGGATDTNRGLVDGGTGVRLTNARVSGLAGGVSSTGLELFGGGTEVTDVVVIARNATSYTRAIFNGASNVVFTNLTATASSTHGGQQLGMYASQGGFTMFDSNIGAEDAAHLDDMAGGPVVLNGTTLNGSRYGIHAEVSSSVSLDLFINHSVVRGPTNTIRFDYADVHVGGTQLAGGGASNIGSGTITCAGTWDESYLFAASGCP